MKSMRFPVHRLMVVVAVLAMNLAVVRALYSRYVMHVHSHHSANAVFGGLCLWLTIQIGTYRAFKTTGLPRKFWAGFLAASLVMTRIYVVCHRGPYSVLGVWWYAYVEKSDLLIRLLVDESFQRFGGGMILARISFLLFTFAWMLPFLLAMILAGVIGRSTIGFRGKGATPSTNLTTPS